MWVLMRIATEFWSTVHRIKVDLPLKTFESFMYMDFDPDHH